jgi:hypothetical protein
MKTSILFVSGALVLGGCASSNANEQPTTPEITQQPMAAQQPDMQGGMMGGHDAAGMCPMAVEGTTARAEDVEGGAAMVFTTTGDVSELRQRVAAMAEMHNRHHAEGSGHGMGMHGGANGMRGAKEPQGDMNHGGMGMMGGGMMMPPSTARSEDIEGGARIVFTPQDPTDLPALREHFAQHAQMMSSGRCPMMSAPAQEPAEAPGGEPSEHESHHP